MNSPSFKFVIPQFRSKFLMPLLKYSYVLIMCMVDCCDCLAENTPSQIIKFKIALDENDHGDKQSTVITAGRSPSSGTTVRVTTLPASLISWTMSLWESSMMERPLTAEMRSPTCSRPQRSVGLPSMIRPILCGITERVRRNEQFRTTRDDCC